MGRVYVAKITARFDQGKYAKCQKKILSLEFCYRLYVFIQNGKMFLIFKNKLGTHQINFRKPMSFFLILKIRKEGVLAKRRILAD